MPLSPDFTKLRKAMRKQYGKEKGDEVFWGYVQKHKLDETKPMSDQKAEATAALIPMLDDDMDEGIDADLNQMGDNPAVMPQPTPTGDPSKPQGLGEADTDKPITIAPGSSALNGDDTPTKEVPLHDQLNRRDQEIPAQAASLNAAQFISVPAYHMEYSAAPKFAGDDAPLLIKSIVLEEGHNVNNWRVPAEEFQSVADQYKAGRQLRVNHDKTVQSVIGRSYDGKVIKGADIKQYLGRDIAGTDPEGQYVVAEFEANPKDPQVRQNILAGYVVTGSIGLDAEAFCEKCDTQLKAGPDGEMVRQCAHHDAPIKLRNVDVKEYSYVAEPAFEHTQAFPSFSAAVDSISKESSLLTTPTTDTQMSSTAPQKVEVQAKAEGKSESQGDANAESDARAEALVKMYQKGLADAMKFRAAEKPQQDDGEPDGDETQASASAEGEGKAEAKADAEGDAEGEADAGVSSPPPLPGQKPKVPASFSRKTDQLSRTGKVAPKAQSATMMDKILNPTATSLAAHPEYAVIFKAAANAPNAPAEVKNRLRGAFE